jgi:hypothetical protein
MSDETYYIVLNVKETASASEIKTAYHDLIKQVHPDTITNPAPYLRKIAEDKAKEITEAYGVLSNSSKRQDYDRQLAAYRRQSAPQARPTPQAPPTPPPQQPSQCPICGRSGGGHSAACVNYRTSQASTSSGPAVNRPRPRTLRWLGYNWAPLIDWSCKHPLIVVLTVLFSSLFIASLFSGENTAQPESKPQSVTNNASAASTGPYSKFPCDVRYTISPIDGKPCSERRDQSIPPPPQGFTVDEKTTGTQSPTPTISVSGTYAGTVHNRTVNLSSTFTVVVHQTEAGILNGCMDLKPPLYGSGVLRGSILGSHVNFAVADVTFQGDASKSGIAGSYVVTRQEGNQLGNFRLMKQAGAQRLYHCDNGVLTAVAKVAPPSSQQFSDVPPGYKVLPPAANLTVQTPNAPTTPLKPPSETRAGPRQPDLSGMTFSERQSTEAACSHEKYSLGPAAYDQCLARQVQAWSSGPKQPDLSGMTFSEQQSIEAACSHEKYSLGPAAYDQCLVRQFEEWTVGPKQPDLSGMTFSERQSIEAACSHEKYSLGPAAYDRCLARQLEALTNYRR